MLQKQNLMWLLLLKNHERLPIAHVEEFLHLSTALCPLKSTLINSCFFVQILTELPEVSPLSEVFHTFISIPVAQTQTAWA